MDAGELNLLDVGSEALNSFANAFSDISQSDFIAQQFKFNEQLAAIQSKEALTAGQVEQEISQQKTAQLSGQQVTAEAAQGVDVHSGTAELTREQTGEIGAKDYLTLGNNAFLKSLGYQIAGENANLEAIQAKNAGVTRATDTLLGGSNEMFQSTMRAVAYEDQSNQGRSPNRPTQQELESVPGPWSIPNP